MSQTNTPLQMQQVFDESDCLYSLDELQKAVAEIGHEISDVLADKNPILLSIMNGGLVFSGQLMPYLNFPLQLDYLHATRYRSETSGGDLEWLVEPSIDMKNRHVVILDDILDEGHTLKAIIDYCEAQGVEKVHTAVLLDKQHDRKAFKGFKADFEGLKVEDRFVFGFGMDYKGYWRNAAGIYAVKGL